MCMFQLLYVRGLPRVTGSSSVGAVNDRGRHESSPRLHVHANTAHRNVDGDKLASELFIMMATNENESFVISSVTSRVSYTLNDVHGDTLDDRSAANCHAHTTVIKAPRRFIVQPRHFLI